MSTKRIYIRPTVEEDGFTPSKFEVNWIRRPRKPKWTYIVVNAKPLYNSTAVDKQDFELHPSDQTDLIINILQLAGITIKDFNLAQAAAMEENADSESGITRVGLGRSLQDRDDNYRTSVSDGGGDLLIANTGSGSAHNNVQPTFILNYIIKT